jgi:hypothetical protein
VTEINPMPAVAALPSAAVMTRERSSELVL